ncbi:MAG: hypothetical protein ACQEXV_17365 [Bacillota bacterium]|uniref:hypothetical protein n=1 Tax=Paenibacillus maysiensis TaxID=1155954 RepID=UPI0012DC5185|nr:hypothetical protein [Paenibacillus maysiensis]
MIDIEQVRERKKLRLDILAELYQLWFGGESSSLVGTKRDIYQERNTERHLAYHYLVCSGLIDITPMDGKGMDEVLSISITAKGIEFLESNLKNE